MMCIINSKQQNKQDRAPSYSKYSGRPRFCNIFLYLLLFGVLALADDDYDFVKEVLDEDDYHDDSQYYTNEDYHEDYHEGYHEDYHEEDSQQDEDKRKEEERRRFAEEEKIAEEKAERVRRQREEAFEAELAALSAEKQKLARKKKQRDAKIVRQILKASKNENHYAVLGLRYMEVQIPSRTIQFGFGTAKWTIPIPGFQLFHISNSKIRRAYRNRALVVHPDKNRDGRAEEAFVAVENAASILSDEQQRKEYDEEIRLHRKKIRQETTQLIRDILDSVIQTTRKIIHTFRTILGPFALPVLIIGSLLI